MSPPTTCHGLPCNIDYTGRAPIDVFFRPTALPDGKFQAATFRGRGLLANAPVDDDGTVNDTNVESNTNPSLNGHLFEIVSAEGGGKQLRSVASFDRFTEWHHEHHLKSVAQKESASHGCTRLGNALDWIEIAAAMHAPLPVPEQK
jgi:hypothetical protein